MQSGGEHSIGGRRHRIIGPFESPLCTGRLLRRRGLEPEAGEPAGLDPLAEESVSLAGLSGASVLGRIALGPRSGGRVRRLGQELDGGGLSRPREVVRKTPK
jgi:hypothetical protein